MYRLILILPEGGYQIATRSRKYDGMYYQPGFTSNPSDPMIQSYTKSGALRCMRIYRKRGLDVLVIDAAKGV